LSAITRAPFHDKRIEESASVLAAMREQNPACDVCRPGDGLLKETQ